MRGGIEDRGEEGGGGVTVSWFCGYPDRSWFCGYPFYRLPVLAAAAPGETYGFSIQYEALDVRGHKVHGIQLRAIRALTVLACA